MARSIKRSEGANKKASVMTNVAKAVGSAMGAIAAGAEKLVSHGEKPQRSKKARLKTKKAVASAKRSPAKRGGKSEHPKKARAKGAKKSNKAKHTGKLGRRTKR